MSSAGTRSVPLVRHSYTPCDAVHRIDVGVQRIGDGLALAYRIEGDIGALRIPAPRAEARESGLWRHTCLEAFVASAHGKGYREFNLAPSGAWAAYGFTSYREGMIALDDAKAPELTVERGEHELELRAKLALEPGARARVALAAVIEESSGRLSYWAIAHPPGKPDFHHPDGFALKI